MSFTLALAFGASESQVWYEALSWKINKKMLFAPKANARIKYLIAYLNKKEIAFPLKAILKVLR